MAVKSLLVIYYAEGSHRADQEQWFDCECSNDYGDGPLNWRHFDLIETKICGKTVTSNERTSKFEIDTIS